ncbi:hypothetical protein AB0J28_26355, partial [Streptosporangium canum]|uniref:hypothetical protein n=1 Tax=Streptosporangium canum TaxID=324952 RepID=UPI003431D6E3
MHARRRLTWIAACGFVVAGLCYSAWLPAQFLNPGIGGPDAYVSELGGGRPPEEGRGRAVEQKGTPHKTKN